MNIKPKKYKIILLTDYLRDIPIFKVAIRSSKYQPHKTYRAIDTNKVIR